MLEQFIYALEDQQHDYVYDFELGVVQKKLAGNDCVALPAWTSHDGCTLIASFIKQLAPLEQEAFKSVFAEPTGVFKRFKQALKQVPWQRLRFERHKREVFARLIESWMAEHPRFEQDPLELYAEDYFDEAEHARELILSECELVSHEDSASISYELMCVGASCVSFIYSFETRLLSISASEIFRESGVVIYALGEVLKALQPRVQINAIAGLPYDGEALKLLETMGWKAQSLYCVPNNEDGGIV